MRFHLRTQTFCCVFMSSPHENDENDVSFSMKTRTFENALQSGKIWKRNSIGVVRTGQFTENTNFWKRLVRWSQSQSTFIEKSKMEDIDRECTVVFNWYRAPILKAWLQMSLCVAFLWTKAAAHLGVVILEFISSIIFFCFVRLLFFRCTAFRGYARQQIKCAPPSPILERGWPW